MKAISRTAFTSVRTEGALLPAETLQRLADGRDVPGLAGADYHLAPGERLNEAINRAWNRCQGAWRAFDEQRARLDPGDTGTTLTRERWLLVLFQELGYGRLPAARAVEAGGVSFPISHLWGDVPIHLVSFRQDLDRRGDGRVDGRAAAGQTAAKGAAGRSPHSLVQEYLNRAPALWGLASNGLRLRVLRDSSSLTRAAYVEFDLAAIMDGELYAEFILLWLVCHQSRVEAEDPADCWLERWSRLAAEQGVRALEALRGGVERAIEALGEGFLAHPHNADLRAALQGGALAPDDYYRELLRLVYRLIFLFVAEDRDLLLAPDTPDEARRRYADHYAAGRLRRLAGSLRGTAHGDLYQALALVSALLRDGYAPLGLPALGGFLFGERATPHLDAAAMANQHLLTAVRALAFAEERGVRRPVDYRNLGAEELGSVYESLLELHPVLNVDAHTFALRHAAGSERKATGSYYTPESLIQCLLDSALEPVVAERLAAARREGRSPEEALLAIKVVDPACGSGHFLIAAAHRLARRLAQERTGDAEPAPGEVREALRQVVGHCVHGVDINEMAVELCKVALWMETLTPGRPLSFLDANIQCGNSLIGATPALLAAGIPDAAFTPIEGDDKAYCQEFRAHNKKEREGQLSLFTGDLKPWEQLGNLAASMMRLGADAEDTIADVRAKETRYADLVRSSGYRYSRLLADAWCAAFVWPKTRDFAYPVTEEVFRRIERNPYDLAKWLEEEIERLRAHFRFFHWHLAFPHVFRPPAAGEEPENAEAGWSGGFDVVLGNPPWERVKLQEKEWFASRAPEIAGAANAAARKKMIEALRETDPALHRAFLDARRQAEAESQFVRASGRFPLCGRGDINTYSVFAELSRAVTGGHGRAGIIVPSGIATDATTAPFFADLATTGVLASLYDFENEERLFPAVHHAMKYSLLTMAGSHGGLPAADLAFFLRQTGQLKDDWRHFTLTADEFALLNPNTLTCPTFRSHRDAEITKAIYRRVPVLIRDGPPEENPWGVRFMAMLHMANDSALFRAQAQLDADGWCLDGNIFRSGDAAYLPLYEAKMVHHFDHRFGTYLGQTQAQANVGTLPTPTADQHADPTFIALPRYWVPEAEVDAALAGRWDRGWLLGWRDITNAKNERTLIAAIVPRVGVGHTMPLFVPGQASASQAACLTASVASYALDYVTRQKVGGTHMTFGYLEQLPILPPATYAQRCPWDTASADLGAWLLPRVLELTYTAWDLAPFARDCGYEGPPFRWDEGRRFGLRCELDAAFFHLYGIGREDVDYIMDTFPVVRRKDEAAHAEYRTKRAILEAYDQMAAAMAGGAVGSVAGPP